jgi:hypothetical protein
MGPGVLFKSIDNISGAGLVHSRKKNAVAAAIIISQGYIF